MKLKYAKTEGYLDIRKDQIIGFDDLEGFDF